MTSFEHNNNIHIIICKWYYLMTIYNTVDYAQ